MNQVTTTARKKPKQKRAQQRRQQILDVSAEILIEQGLERFNTALVTERLGISIGSLYRYFPNKQSILYTLAEQWLEANRDVFRLISSWDLENMSLADYVNGVIDQFAQLYQSENTLTQILAVIIEVPELTELNNEHDSFVMREMGMQFKRLGLNQSKAELDRLIFMAVTQAHYNLIVLLTQSPSMAKRSLGDIKTMFLALLEKHSR